MPHVSVIVPTLARVPHLENCLVSLLSQTRKPDEVIIVDNSPGKKAKHIVQKFNSSVPLRYCAEPKNGAAYARNTGILRAKYEAVAFIDDDCRADKKWLNELLKAYESGGKTFIQGTNRNGLPGNFFATLHYFKDELFLRSGFMNRKNGQAIPWFDSKNFLVSKALLAEKRIRFSHFAIFQDLDMTLQMLTQQIRVTPAPQAIVYHYGRDGFIQSMKKWITLGIDRYYLHRAWLKKGLLFFPPERGRRTAREKAAERKLSKNILENRPFLYKAVFYFWYRLSVRVTETAFFFTKLHHWKT